MWVFILSLNKVPYAYNKASCRIVGKKSLCYSATPIVNAKD